MIYHCGKFDEDRVPSNCAFETNNFDKQKIFKASEFPRARVGEGSRDVNLLMENISFQIDSSFQNGEKYLW